MGRNKFSQREITEITKLLRRKASGSRFVQKLVRHDLRVDYEFNISDFNEPGKAFGADDLQRCIERGRIVILDDATIEAMKAKRARDKAHDAALAEAAAIEAGEATDWRKAQEEWEEWERNQKEA
ncbi:MAG: hypothetical protein KBT12_04780 [Bacteroidales bacterium]|nr:hypothetical protein [Candidatus Physcousia equi]